jgi:photosystem II stability/assembly factor-like uncharacterized protein
MYRIHKAFAGVVILTVVGIVSSSQTIQILDSSQRGISFRGLSAPADNVIWVSGTKGTIGRSADGGKTWQWVNPRGYEARDFRDIEALDANTAVAMAVDNPGLIIKTRDGGATWQKVLEVSRPGMFLDAMAFADSRNGACIGDPIDGRFYLLVTTDGGDTWQKMPDEQCPAALPGEACFAASGTNIRALDARNGYRFGFVSGGTAGSRLHLVAHSNGELPSAQMLFGLPKSETGGANSWVFNKWGLLVAGGDFARPNLPDSNLLVSENGGLNWSVAEKAFEGYKSCITAGPAGDFVACGTSGVAISGKYMKHWKTVTSQPYHVAQRARRGKVVYLAGPNGKIAQLKY